jgi:hypothetical protein
MSLLSHTRKINFVQSVEHSFLRLSLIMELKIMIQVLGGFQGGLKQEQTQSQIDLVIGYK